MMENTLVCLVLSLYIMLVWRCQEKCSCVMVWIMWLIWSILLKWYHLIWLYKVSMLGSNDVCYDMIGSSGKLMIFMIIKTSHCCYWLLLMYLPSYIFLFYFYFLSITSFYCFTCFSYSLLSSFPFFTPSLSFFLLSSIFSFPTLSSPSFPLLSSFISLLYSSSYTNSSRSWTHHYCYT